MSVRGVFLWVADSKMPDSPYEAASAECPVTSALRSRCGYYYDLRLWSHLDLPQVERWLSNFRPDELPYAEAILDSLIYLNNEMIERQFASAFHSLSAVICGDATDFTQAKAAWQRFRDEVHVTHVTGEAPNPTDSGHTFARHARQTLLIDETHIFSPESALHQQLVVAPAPLVFVDDFSGSGNQFLDTWTRAVPVGTGLSSFEGAAAAGKVGPVYYCLPVITDYALNESGARRRPSTFKQHTSYPMSTARGTLEPSYSRRHCCLIRTHF